MNMYTFLEFVNSIKDDDNAAIIEAIEDAVLVIMLPEGDSMPIKNRFTLNKNKAANLDNATPDEEVENDNEDIDTSTILLTQLAGNLFNTD